MGTELNATHQPAVLSSEVHLASPFMGLASVPRQGESHLIVVGKVKQITNAGSWFLVCIKWRKRR
ncbi:hypothetical protein SPTER_42820 [Sporomusa termitida]|uniref:Uncharacterized protein n=1 Tax=Sporomusa termitida TaxID=2377 RepID=A0A517DZQ9_9FIRM|nr:hypothetical protein SPTER_42820 [Sporomusa termitida]